MSSNAEHCPECGASLQGPAIPEESRHYYARIDASEEEVKREAPTHYSRKIGVELPGVYDGVLLWQCPACDANWHRWGSNAPWYAAAERFITEQNKRRAQPRDDDD